MHFIRIPNLIVVLLLSVLIGCGDDGFNVGGGNGSGFNFGGGGGFGGGSNGGDNSNSTQSLAATLDCQELDPDKVYVFGTLSGRFVEAFALADPDEPTSFCVAFPSEGIPLDDEAIISSAGDIIFHEDDKFYSMVPDTISRPTFGEMSYPLTSSLLLNDKIVTEGIPFNDVEQMVSIPSTNEDEIFYKEDDTRNIYSSLDNEIYYNNPNRHELIGAREDGSLILFSEASGVIVLSDELNETIIAPPVSGPFEFTNVPAKRASDGTIWIAVALRSDPDTFLRWRLAANNTLLNEGSFAALPDGFAINNNSISLFDGVGNIYDNANSDEGSAIVLRPIASSNTSSRVIYFYEFNEENVDRNWKVGSDQFVTPYKLFTGS